jgi:four helix bundle protein
MNDKKGIQERTFDFAVRIVKFYLALPKELRFSGPARQLLNAGTSIGANTEEVQGGLTRKDFIHSINIAKKEARETIYWLKIWIEAELANCKEAELILREAMEIKNILTSIVKTSQRNLTYNS